jgi:signal transduction histidine kinase
MIDSTLTFARDDAADEHRLWTDLAAMLRTICDDLSDAGHPIKFSGPDRLPLVYAPGSIKRALQNVIGNALKYGKAATVELKEGPERAVVRVLDRGPGIQADKREEVFRPFFRLESSRNRETGGSGLGLAVARSIVRRHGGDIELADRDGGGLEVRLFLPHMPIAATHSADGGNSPA